MVLQQGVEDKVIWKWSSSGLYSARSAYAALTMGQTALYGAKGDMEGPCAAGAQIFHLASLAGSLLDE